MGFFNKLAEATKKGLEEGTAAAKADQKRKEEEEMRKHIAICELQERERRNKR